jgi:hypothetical protein
MRVGLSATAALLLTVLGLFVAVPSASAHAGAVHGTTTCAPDGKSYTVDWTVSNDPNASFGDATISNVRPAGAGLPSSIPAGGQVAGQQTIPSSQAAATLTLDLTWAKDHFTQHNISGSVQRPAECSPPVEIPGNPSYTKTVECGHIAIVFSNDAAEHGNEHAKDAYFSVKVDGTTAASYTIPANGEHRTFTKDFAEDSGKHTVKILVDNYVREVVTVHSDCQPPPVPQCVPAGSATYDHTPIHIADGEAWSTVSVHGDKPLCEGVEKTFSLNSYRTEGPSWPTSGTQTFVKHVSATLSKVTHSADLHVPVPDCFFQIDLYGNGHAYDGNDGAVPHYPNVATPDDLIQAVNGGKDCAPPEQKPANPKYKVKVECGEVHITLTNKVYLKDGQQAADATFTVKVDGAVETITVPANEVKHVDRQFAEDSGVHTVQVNDGKVYEVPSNCKPDVKPANPQYEVKVECGQVHIDFTNKVELEQGEQAEDATFTVKVDGAVVKTITLPANQTAEFDQTFAEDSGTHTVQVNDGQVYQVESDCQPNQVPNNPQFDVNQQCGQIHIDFTNPVELGDNQSTQPAVFNVQVDGAAPETITVPANEARQFDRTFTEDSGVHTVKIFVGEELKDTVTVPSDCVQAPPPPAVAGVAFARDCTNLFVTLSNSAPAGGDAAVFTIATPNGTQQVTVPAGAADQTVTVPASPGDRITVTGPQVNQSLVYTQPANCTVAPPQTPPQTPQPPAQNRPVTTTEQPGVLGTHFSSLPTTGGPIGLLFVAGLGLLTGGLLLTAVGRRRRSA